MEIKPIAYIKTDFKEKFGIPRQSGIIENITGEIIFEKEFRNPDSLRGIKEYSHLWLIFDFSKLDFMDSSGIGIIIGRYKLMCALNGSVSIIVTKPTVRKLLELSGIKRIVRICDNLSDALKTA